ncbi:MAG: transcription antitermination factor NusB [Lachnospiraceae bacterium]|nr:transcription antitermination factor NusB [Lachnospiraceae bacterium]
MTRSMLREELFRLLFRAEFMPREELSEQKELFFADSSMTDEEKDDISLRFDDIISKLGEIDGKLSERVTGWNIDRIGKAELTILRLAVYEIDHDDRVPTGAAINEAVELAKKYGQDNSSSFVNGVLAKFA